MRLLIATGIYPPEIGGPAGYVKGLATELTARGHHVQVVTYGDEKTETNEKCITNNEQPGIRFRVIVVMRFSLLVIRYWRYMLAVRRLARNSDLVYLQGPVSEGLPGMLGAMLAGKPTVLKVVGDYAWEQYQQQPITNYELRITNQDGRISKSDHQDHELLDEFLTHGHKGKVWLMEAIERWVAKRARTVIVPSKFLKTVVERWGIASERIRVVYNSIAPLPSQSPPVRQMSASPISDGRKVILTAVRAVPWKGVDFLCDCLKDLPKEYVLAVAGEGPCLEDWKKHTQEVGVADRVQWLGRLSRAELADWYRKAHLFVLATGYEGFPHVVVEACSVGLQCIVSDRGGNPETKDFFPDLVTVAPYRDKQAWVEKIKINCHSEGNRSDRENLRIETPSEALSAVLSFGRMVDETEDVLKNLI